MNNNYPNNQNQNNPQAPNQNNQQTHFPNNQQVPYQNGLNTSSHYQNNQYQNNQYQNNQYQNNHQTHFSNNQRQNVPPKKKSSAKTVLMIVGICLAAVLLLVVGAVRFFDRIFYGKTDASPLRNKRWVKMMNETFPDDEFTFKSYDRIGVTGLGSFKNKNRIVVSSKKYPKKRITIGWDDKHTQIVTDYNYLRYKEELEQYYEDKMSAYFSADDMEVMYLIALDYMTEVKDYSLDEFRIAYQDVCIINLSLRFDGAFPSKEEMTRNIEDIIKDLDIQKDLTIFLSHDSLDILDNTAGNEKYDLIMESPTKIAFLNHYIVSWEKTKTGKDVRNDIKETIYENKDLD